MGIGDDKRQMAILTAPASNTRMIRYGEFWGNRKWHILRAKSEETGICGTVCINPEYDILMNVRAKDICKQCWRFEAYDGEFKEPK